MKAVLLLTIKFGLKSHLDVRKYLRGGFLQVKAVLLINVTFG